MAESNLQDAIALNSDTLAFKGEQIQIGTGAGSKSIVMSNDVGAVHLVADPTVNRTIALPTAGGTIALLSNIGLTALSAGTTRGTSGEIVFSNSNNVSFGMDGNTVTATATFAGGAGMALSAGTQSVNTGTLVFSDSNGVTFGMSGSSHVTASFSTLVFSNSNNVSFGINAGTLTATATVAATAETPFGVSAGTQSVSTGTLVFSNSNNVSFGMSGSSRVTASASFPAETPFGVSAGTQSVSTGTLVFSDSNGVTFGMSGSSRITASFSSVVFSNSNNVSFGLNGSTITATATVAATAETPFGVSAGTQSVSTGTLVFSNSNNVTFGMSGSSRVTASASFPAETPFGISAGTQSVSTGTLVFSDSNGISFGMSGSSRITATADYVRSISAGTTNATGNQIVFSNSNGVSFGANGATITATVVPGAAAGIAAITAGTQQATSGTMLFADSNGLSFGMSGSSQITVSYDAIKSISGGTTRATNGEIVFSNSNGVSFGVNGNTITASMSLLTLSGYNPYADNEFIAGAVGAGTLKFEPENLPNVQFDRLVIPIINTNSSNSSGSHTLSFWFGLYTRNASTLSLLASVSSSTALTHSGTAGSYSLYSGLRLFTIAMTTTLTAGDYWAGFVSRTTSGGANGSYSNLVLSNLATNFLGHFGSSHNTTMQFTLGQGFYTATTSAMPASVAFSQIRGSESLQFRSPLWMLASGTV